MQSGGQAARHHDGVVRERAELRLVRCAGFARREVCYWAGCACFGTTINTPGGCTGAQREAARASYSCPLLARAFVLPGQALVTMTVYDFDTGFSGDYVEQFTVPSYAYYRTPLRAASNNIIASTIAVNQTSRTFTATAPGDSSDNPTDAQALTDAQASRGLQLFFLAQQGYVEGTFAVRSTNPDCTGRNLLFAGDSALCAPPPNPPQPPASPLTHRHRRQYRLLLSAASAVATAAHATTAFAASSALSSCRACRRPAGSSTTTITSTFAAAPTFAAPTFAAPTLASALSASNTASAAGFSFHATAAASSASLLASVCAARQHDRRDDDSTKNQAQV